MYLLLTLIYFHLECKILVNIADSVLDSALTLREKEGDIVREKKVSNVNGLVRIKPKHANSKIKFFSREIKHTAEYVQSLLTFCYVLFF